MGYVHSYDSIVMINPVTVGEFYLPPTLVEAMYNNDYRVVTEGRKVEVLPPDEKKERLIIILLPLILADSSSYNQQNSRTPFPDTGPWSWMKRAGTPVLNSRERWIFR